MGVAGCPGIPGRIKSVGVAGYCRYRWPDDLGIRRANLNSTRWCNIGPAKPRKVANFCSGDWCNFSPALTPAERALHPIGIGRKNWLVAGADTGAETLARAMTFIETAKLNDIDPRAYLADVLDRIHDHKINKLDELLPWNWKELGQAADRQAA
jgi:hypothetical protein